MGLIALDETSFLTVGDSVSLRWTEIETWTSRELARVALAPSVTELALAVNGDLYLAAYQATTNRGRMSFAVIRARLPPELGDLRLHADLAMATVATRSITDTSKEERDDRPTPGLLPVYCRRNVRRVATQAQFPARPHQIHQAIQSLPTERRQNEEGPHSGLATMSVLHSQFRRRRCRSG